MLLSLSSSVNANNRANNILVLGKDFIQGINGTTIYAEKMYSTNFTVTIKNFCLSLHYNGDSSYLFVNGIEIINFKDKDSEIVPYPLCLGNISKDISPLNTTNTGLFGYIHMTLVLIIKPLKMIKYMILMEKNNKK